MEMEELYPVTLIRIPQPSIVLHILILDFMQDGLVLFHTGDLQGV